MCSTSAGRVVNRVDLEQASRAMSDLGLNCLRGLSDWMLGVVSANQTVWTLNGRRMRRWPWVDCMWRCFWRVSGVRRMVWTLRGHCPLSLLLRACDGLCGPWVDLACGLWSGSWSGLFERVCLSKCLVWLILTKIIYCLVCLSDIGSTSVSTEVPAECIVSELGLDCSRESICPNLWSEP